METPCSRPLQTITEIDFLGNSLRKINDNFQILQLNLCQLEHVVKALRLQLDELDVPEKPRCGEIDELAPCSELERVVKIPDPETCVQDTRLPLVNSFINLKDLSCKLYTTLMSLSSVVGRNEAGKNTTQMGPFIPTGCTFTDGISPDEYMGDSYDKIRSNLIRLRDEYCRISNIINNLEKRINCPPDPEKRQRLLNRFTMQGEGGYAWDTYNFVNRDKIYATPSYAAKIQSNMGGASEYNKYRYITTYDGTVYHGLSGAIRVCQASNNQAVIMRNGMVYYSGNGPYKSTWVENNATIMWDMFMPSIHGTGGPTQVVLLTTGNLHFLDLRSIAANPNHIPPVILPNINRFAAINQSHNSDLIVISSDKKVYHVGTHSTNGSPNPYGYQEITNMGDTDDIAFMQIGDAADSCYVCYKSDNRRVYPINCSVANRTGHDQWGWFTSRNNTPRNIRLDADEFFVDGCSNEFDNVFLTNKRVLCYHNIDLCCGGSCGIMYAEHSLPTGSKAVRMVTSCSYSMAVELSDGYYLLSRRPISSYGSGHGPSPCGSSGSGYPTYQYFAKFNLWNTLVKNLSSTRPDIFGFGKDAIDISGGCSCDGPPVEPPVEPCVPRRWDLLDRFAMQGEGGYWKWTYNFVNKDQIYGNEVYKNVAFNTVLGTHLTTYYYTTSLGGKTWHALKNAIRICDGNTNTSGIFRDGNAYVSGTKFYHQWIVDTYLEWKDLFMPSSYANPNQGRITQGVLRRNGQLHALLLNAANFTSTNTWPTVGPPVVQGETETGAVVPLDNIDRFLTINQAHNSDIFVAGKDNKVWHVTFVGDRSGFTGAGYGKQIRNLDANQLLCICIGDPARSAYCVYKSNPTLLYEIECSTSVRDLGNFGWFTERNPTPICAGVNQPLNLRGQSYPNFLEAGEQFIDMAANEFHWVFLTNKNVHCFQGQRAVGGYKKFAIPPGVSAVRMCTSTSYSMAAELSDGYYLIADQGASAFENSTNTGGSGSYGLPYQFFERVPSWTLLAQSLSSTRPDVVPFGTTCDQDPTWNCLKTFVEDAQVMMFPQPEDVTLLSNVFYPVSAYQEGGAFLDAGGAGFTGTTIVTFRHPNYPTVSDVVFTCNSVPTPGQDDAIIYWSAANGTVKTYRNYTGVLLSTDPLPWKERNDILVSHRFIDGVYQSVIAKKYKEPTDPVCFFPA